MNPLGLLSRLLFDRLRWLVGSGDARDAEILALRHQVMVLRRQVAKPRLAEGDRTLLAVLSSAMER